MFSYFSFKKLVTARNLQPLNFSEDFWKLSVKFYSSKMDISKLLISI